MKMWGLGEPQPRAQRGAQRGGQSGSPDGARHGGGTEGLGARLRGAGGQEGPEERGGENLLWEIPDTRQEKERKQTNKKIYNYIYLLLLLFVIMWLMIGEREELNIPYRKESSKIEIDWALRMWSETMWVGGKQWSKSNMKRLKERRNKSLVKWMRKRRMNMSRFRLNNWTYAIASDCRKMLQTVL